DRLEARIPHFHPALAGVALRERWGGPIAFTQDRTPVLSRMPRAPGVVVSAGCAGHGIALGVRVGQLVADALAGGSDLPGGGGRRPNPVPAGPPTGPAPPPGPRAPGEARRRCWPRDGSASARARPPARRRGRRDSARGG